MPSNLLLGGSEALRDLLVSFSAAPAQAPLQFLAARRRHKYEDCLEAAAAHQACALHVDVQDAAAPRRSYILYGLRTWAC